MGRAVTLLPASDFRIRGHKGNAYDVPPLCAHPHCSKAAAHVHHCWPRSYLRSQPREWVQLPDGVVIGNRMGFCVEHHDMLTGQIGGYRARLEWVDGLMHWVPRIDMRADSDDRGAWGMTMLLKYQPPAFGHDMAHPELEPGDVCPTCGHHKTSREKPKPAKPERGEDEWVDWVVRAPAPIAEMLNEFVEDFAIPLGVEEKKIRVRRALVLAQAVAWMGTVRHEFIADVAAAMERRLTKDV
jgi:hypothetical protein